ncbi:hypothetical protein HLB42_16450 [Deinococcus sp. D7000]|nr:hypothetical protein HLB42_16450 [Deinococcus sp. D7000]
MDAQILAGQIHGDPQSHALWDRVREREPEAWTEMAQWVISESGGDLLRALYRQCSAGWGARVPLSEALAAELGELVAEMVERWG